MSLSAFGIPVKGEVVSADASGAGVAVTFWQAGSAGGAANARALASTEFLTITDVIFISTVGGVYDLVCGAATDGLHIVKGNAEAKGGIAVSFETPVVCPKGVTPTLIAAAGQVDLILTGYINKV